MLLALAGVVLLTTGALAYWVLRGSEEQTYGMYAYTDGDLGIQGLVDSFVADENYYAKYRTDAESGLERAEEERWFDNEAEGHPRERYWFELQMWLVLAAARANLPEHLGENGALGVAFRDALDECASDAGYPGVRLYEDPNIDPERLQNDGQALRAERDAEFERYESEYGLDYESFVDLRHGCHQYADDYPTLAIGERDKLLNERHRHFVDAFRAVVREHPEHAVPVEWHPGAPQPWADHLIDQCRAAASGDRAILEECADEYRVEIPVN